MTEKKYLWVCLYFPGKDWQAFGSGDTAAFGKGCAQK